MKTLFLLVLAALMVGCASRPKATPEDVADADQPLICTGKEQCDLFWQRSLFFVNHNSIYRVQMNNESLIQTYNPMAGHPDLAFNVSREPMGSGSYRIWVKVYCDNMFGCVPDMYLTVARFKRYVRTGAPG